MEDNITDVYIIGCGGHARFIIGLLFDSSFRILGAVDVRSTFDQSEEIMGVNVVSSLSDILHSRHDAPEHLVLALGDNETRANVYLDLHKLGKSFPNIIHPSAVIDSSASMGQGNILGPNVVIGAEVEIGSNNIINTGAIIEHGTLIGDHCHVSLGAILCGNTCIRDRVFLGARSVVTEKNTVLERSVLGAGAVLIHSNKSAGSILLGCPAVERER